MTVNLRLGYQHIWVDALDCLPNLDDANAARVKDEVVLDTPARKMTFDARSKLHNVGENITAQTWPQAFECPNVHVYSE